MRHGDCRSRDPGSELDQRLQRGFRIGAFDVEPLAGLITGPDGAQHVQPKVMDVLVCLAQESGALVERDALLDRVWRRVTSEEVLTRCISELRRVLGDHRDNPRYIQTVPKRGYRLVEPVVLADACEINVPAAEPVKRSNAAVDPPARSSAIASIAVLPFDNHSADPAHAFTGDAFAAELHTTLARVDRLQVVSRRSSFVFKDISLDIREIGGRLGVDYVISGSLQCNGLRLRVVAELNEAKGGTQVWAKSYDRSSDDLLSVEREVAEAIVASFTTQQLLDEIRRSRHKSTSSLDAWGLVQKARACVLEHRPERLADAIEPLKLAIEMDADYPAAHATLASLLIERLVNGLSETPQQDELSAIEAAGTALALAPEDPFILKMVSLVWAYTGDHRRAINCLRKAVNYTPFDFGAWGYLGWPLTATGDAKDLKELRAILDRLLSMEPQHPGAAFWLYHRSVAETCEGAYERAADAAEAAVDLRPSLSLAWMHYANVLGHLKKTKAAREAVEQCRKVNHAMTPEHFASLIKRMSQHAAYAQHRLGGLREIGALRN
jgi:TolB-like protein